MNDITALAQRMKAAAEKATRGDWTVQFGDEIYAVDGVNNDQVAVATFDANDADHIALSNPVNVLALVEALESGDTENERMARDLISRNGEIEGLRKRVEELEEVATDYGMTPKMLSLMKELRDLRRNSPATPDGWVMVPEEPTHEMLEAGDEKFGTYDVYRRMLAAAPQQEAKK